ncbi:DinB family protein [Thermoflexibacter ruber]|uniref:DinB superfamily protein n=1 Tax=Thermoflexibacter ruber TaxID=1003 RepID=A0A1I2HGY3_9BACT|nr:DinB family protein [Thermoflexibacter ruber]SFF28026.1 DinB superfamily protein [Thermoflexibacter ruber]
MNWITEIDQITDAFKQNFSHLNNAQLNWKPNLNAWSIAQNMEHLIVVNESYYPVLASLKEGTYKTPLIAKIGFMVSFFGKIVLKAVSPDRRKKMKTFPIWQPSTSEVHTDILMCFDNHQNELKRQIENAKVFVEKGVTISSPADKNIVYKLGTAFDIIVTHEKRHLEQAKEVLNLLNNTSQK